MSTKTVLENEFIGRRRELNLFRRLLNSTTDKRLLSLYGIGGIGKSWIVEKLIAECQANNEITHAYIDFSDIENIDLFHILTNLQEQLGADFFPELSSVINEFYQRMHTVFLLPNIGQDDSSFVVNINIHKNKFEGGVRDVAGIKVENPELMLPPEEVNRLMQELQRNSTEVFIKELKRLATKKSVVLFFDTYEKVEDPNADHRKDLARWLRLDLLRILLGDASSTVKVVITGRPLLTWVQEDREWRRLMEQLEVVPFTRKETSIYCHRRGIARGDMSLKKSIFKLTRGHPQCVSIACDLVEDARQQGKIITSDVFEAYRGDFDTKLVSEFLLRRILERLPKETANAVQYCAIPHRFDAGIIRRLMPQTYNGREILDRISRYSFVQSIAEGGYRYHDIIRKLLIAKWRHDDLADFIEIQNNMIEFLEQKIDEQKNLHGKWQLLLEKLYHQIHANEEEAIASLRGLYKNRNTVFNLSFCEQLVDILDDASEEAMLTSNNRAWVEYSRRYLDYLRGSLRLFESKLHTLFNQAKTDPELRAIIAANLGSLFREQGRLDESIDALQDSLELMRSLNDHSGIIQLLNELGTTYRTKIELETALQYYQWSRNTAITTQQEQFNYDIAYSALYSGVVLTGLGNYEEAISSYNEALAIFTRLNNQYGIAQVYKRLGWQARIQGNLDEAANHHKDALAITKDLGLPFPHAELLHSFANVYRQQEKWSEAEKYYQQARAIFQKLGALRHLGILLNDLGQCFQGRALYDSDPELLKKALKNYEDSIEILIPLNQRKEISTPLYYMGEVYRIQKQWDEAELYLLLSLRVSRNIKVRINQVRALAALCELSFMRELFLQMKNYGGMSLFMSETDGYNHYTARVYRVFGDYNLQIASTTDAARSYAHALIFALLYNEALFKQVRNHVLVYSAELLRSPNDVKKFIGNVMEELRYCHDQNDAISFIEKDLLDVGQPSA